jgi:hypothetical protein
LRVIYQGSKEGCEEKAMDFEAICVGLWKGDKPDCKGDGGEEESGVYYFGVYIGSSLTRWL